MIIDLTGDDDEPVPMVVAHPTVNGRAVKREMNPVKRESLSKGKVRPASPAASVRVMSHASASAPLCSNPLVVPHPHPLLRQAGASAMDDDDDIMIIERVTPVMHHRPMDLPESQDNDEVTVTGEVGQVRPSLSKKARRFSTASGHLSQLEPRARRLPRPCKLKSLSGCEDPSFLASLPLSPPLLAHQRLSTSGGRTYYTLPRRTCSSLAVPLAPNSNPLVYDLCSHCRHGGYAQRRTRRETCRTSARAAWCTSSPRASSRPSPS